MKRILAIVALCMSLPCHCEEVKPRMVPFASSAIIDGITLKLEHPRILIGSGEGAAPNADNLIIHDVEFLGMGIALCKNTLYINESKYAIPKNTKEISISDNRKSVMADGILLEALKLDKSDVGLIVRPEQSEVTSLDNGYKIQINGVLGSGRSGVVLDGDHCIFSIGIMVYKVWGTEVFLWDKKVGDLKQTGKDKVLVIDGLKDVYQK